MIWQRAQGAAGTRAYQRVTGGVSWFARGATLPEARRRRASVRLFSMALRPTALRLPDECAGDVGRAQLRAVLAPAACTASEGCNKAYPSARSGSSLTATGWAAQQTAADGQPAASGPPAASTTGRDERHAADVAAAGLLCKPERARAFDSGAYWARASAG